jgi:hypothetical protein
MRFSFRNLCRPLRRLQSLVAHRRESRLRSKFLANNPLSQASIGLVPQFGIGDIFLVSALAGHVKRNFRAEKIRVLVREKHLFIPRLFESIDEIVCVPNAIDIRKIGEYEPQLGKYLYAHFPGLSMLEIVGRKGVTFGDCYKAILRVDENSPFDISRQPTRPELDKSIELLKRVGAVPGQTVVICPSAVSTSPYDRTPREFWGQLARSLEQAGLSIVVNRDPKEQVRSDEFTSVAVPLELFRAYVYSAGYMVATRSGLCDLVSDLELNLAVVYPYIIWHGGRLIDGAGLQVMGLNTTAFELVLEPDKTGIAIDAVMQFFQTATPV